MTFVALARAARALIPFAAAFALQTVGCASHDDSDDGSEGALSETEPNKFAFRVDSPKERSGEVDPDNAYWALRLSSLAYEVNDEAALRGALEKIGVHAEQAIAFHAGMSKNPLTNRAVIGTDGIYFRTKDAGFLVFRGSEDGKLNDAIADASVLQIEAKITLNRASEGRVHAGFHFALKAVWDQLRPELKTRHQTTGLPLYIMGHSLGGAIGTLAMHQLLFDECLNSTIARVDVLGRCERNYVPVAGLYTFGSPRVGNEKFISMLTDRAQETNTKLFRFVNEGDQVSMLPRYLPVAIVEPYRHLGDNGDERSLAILLERDGKLVPKPQGRCGDNDKLVQCDVSLYEAVNGVVNGKPPWKVEHQRAIYLEKMRAAVTGTAAKLDVIRSRLEQQEAQSGDQQ
jgi:hypothetical protein